MLDLGPISDVLSDLNGAGVRRQLKFVRRQGQEVVTVGRFIVNLKVVGDEIVPVENEYKQLDRDEIFHELPRPDPFFDFLWRVRVDIRSATGLLINRVNPSGLPSSQVICGWTLYDTQVPDELGTEKTEPVASNRHPVYNAQFLIKEGFIYFCVRDTFVPEQPLEEFHIPINPLKPFVPVNFVRIPRRTGGTK